MAAERPPLGTRFKYNLLGVTPPIQYRKWVERDIASRTWPFRLALVNACWLALGLVVGSFFVSGAFPVMAWLIGGLGGALIASVVVDQRGRRLRYHQRRWGAAEGMGESGIRGPASPG